METTTKKDKAERDTICGLTHLNRSQFLIPCYQDLKKSDLHTYTGTSLHPWEKALILNLLFAQGLIGFAS